MDTVQMIGLSDHEKRAHRFTSHLFLAATVLVGASGLVACGSGGGSDQQASDALADSNSTNNQVNNLISNSVTDIPIIPTLKTAEEVNAFVKELAVLPVDGDFDNDGLTNQFELSTNSPTLLPTLADSNGNGIADGLEDFDNDGLSNLEEQALASNPLQADSDQDGLSDKVEQQLGTNPTVQDSDGDGLSDAEEVKRHSNPLLQDSDGDGTLDNKEAVVVTATDAVSGSEFLAPVTADLDKSVTIVVESPDASERLIPGLASGIIRVSSVETEDEGRVFIPVTPEMLAIAGEVGRLKIVAIDYASNTIDILREQGVNDSGDRLWGLTDKVLSYAVVVESDFQAAFAETFNGSTRQVNNALDLLLVMDTSASIKTNDPSDLRIVAAQALISGLLPDFDRVGVINFDLSATVLQPLSENFVASDDVLKNLSSEGSDTNITAAIVSALDEFKQNPSDNSSLIVLLTDGEGGYDTALTRRAKAGNVRIFTVSLGSSVDNSLLKEIANGTGGRYFQTATADELLVLFEALRIELQDTDKDGLSDFAELNGMRNWLGYTITTDPTKADTDNDGLLDGEEMQVMSQNAVGREQYNMISDPNSQDTDEDGLQDFAELRPVTNVEVTSPLKKDTDEDGLADNVDSYPNRVDWYGRGLVAGDIILAGRPLSALFQEECLNAADIAVCQTAVELALGDYSQAALYLGDEQVIEYHARFGETLGEPVIGVHSLQHYLSANGNGVSARYEQLAFLTVPSATLSTRQAVVEEAKAFIGQSYEYPSWSAFREQLTLVNSLESGQLIADAWSIAEQSFVTENLIHPFPWLRASDLYNSSAVTVSRLFD